MTGQTLCAAAHVPISCKPGNLQLSTPALPSCLSLLGICSDCERLRLLDQQPVCVDSLASCRCCAAVHASMKTETGPKADNCSAACRMQGWPSDAGAMDLLGKMLPYDPEQRLTAQQALQHPYFSQVRAC